MQLDLQGGPGQGAAAGGRAAAAGDERSDLPSAAFCVPHALIDRPTPFRMAQYASKTGEPVACLRDALKLSPTTTAAQIKALEDG